MVNFRCCNATVFVDHLSDGYIFSSSSVLIVVDDLAFAGNIFLLLELMVRMSYLFLDTLVASMKRSSTCGVRSSPAACSRDSKPSFWEWISVGWKISNSSSDCLWRHLGVFWYYPSVSISILDGCGLFVFIVNLIFFSCGRNLILLTRKGDTNMYVADVRVICEVAGCVGEREDRQQYKRIH